MSCCISWPCLRSYLFGPFPLSVCWSSYERTPMASLASMATPGDGNVTAVAKNEVFANINFVAIYYVKSATRNAFLRKNIS